MLGAADADLLFGAIDAVAAGDARSALLAAARLADSGRDIGRFFGDLEAHARSLMIVQTLGGEVPPEISVTAEQDERLREQAARVSPTDVVRVLDLIAVGLRGDEGRLRRPHPARARARQGRGAEGRQLREGPAVPARAAGGGPSGADARTAGREERGGPGHRRRPRRAHERLAEGGRPLLSLAARGRLGGTPSGRPLPARPSGRRAPEIAAPAGPSSPSREPSVTAVAVVDPPGQEPVVAAVGLDLDAFAELWPAVIESIQAERPLLAEHLKVARPSALGNGELTLAWAETAGLSKRKAEDAANRELIVRRDPRGHRRRPAARPRAGGRHPRGERADALARRARRALRGRVRGRDPGRPGGDVLMPPQPNMQKMLQQVQKMQQEMMAAQESLKDERVEASAGGGMVKVVATGELHIESVTIDPDAVDPEDVEMLQDTVLAAVNEALRSAQELAADKMGAATGGLGGPGGGLGGLGLPGL